MTNDQPRTSAAKKEALFGQARLDELSLGLTTARTDGQVAFSTKIKRSTYLFLKQASHHLGIIEMDFVDAAIREKLERTPGADQPMPPGKLAALERGNKKLRG